MSQNPDIPAELRKMLETAREQMLPAEEPNPNITEVADPAELRTRDVQSGPEETNRILSDILDAVRTMPERIMDEFVDRMGV